MRDFTPEEKELIASTPITKECFDFENQDKHAMRLGFGNDPDFYTIKKAWNQVFWICDDLRQLYLNTKDERYFIELVRLLPGSYKVVNLAEMPDLEKLTNGIIQRTR
jgi:hypothetical protein